MTSQYPIFDNKPARNRVHKTSNDGLGLFLKQQPVPGRSADAVRKALPRADELAAQDDYNGAAVWRRITNAVGQLANQTRSAVLTTKISFRNRIERSRTESPR
jgi:hypothetical protein